MNSQALAKPDEVSLPMGTGSILLSHPTGNQNVRNALKGLAEHNILLEFWTTIAWDAASIWNRLIPARMRDQLLRRAFAEAPKGRVKSVPSRELVRLGMRSSPAKKLLCSGERPFSVIGMYRHFDGRVARRVKEIKPIAVYAYEGGALQTFRQAKELGVQTFYELPSSHWYWEYKLLCEEAKRNPEYAGLLPKLRDTPGHMKWKDEELDLADQIFVPSEHVRSTLAGVVPECKIRIVGYGAPNPRPRCRIGIDSTKALKVLFVGALVQRKGIGYLLEAIEMLGSQMELTIVGKRMAPNRRVDAACNRWRWFESLPHSSVLDLMQEADVLVLPSLAEGCALVVLEALACGLPVIVTPHTGSAEFVRDGCEGFVVPICSSEAVADRLQTLARDRKLLVAMSHNAHIAAAAKSWEYYRARWVETVMSLC